MKQVIIMVGISGSGKSTAAKKFAADVPGSVICSADDFFVDNDGNYNFDASKLGAAHHTCLTKFNNSLAVNAPLIIVDNTNLRVSSIRPYIEAATAQNYKIAFAIIDCPVDVAAARNLHGVPLVTVQNMRAQFESLLKNMPKEWLSYEVL